MCMGSHVPPLPLSPWQQRAACAAAEEELPSWAQALGESDSPRTLPSGDQVARLMLIHSLADAAADAVLLGQPLTAPDRASLLYLWPNLLRLTAAAPPGVAATASPFAAAANVVLVERHDCFAAAPVALTLPQLHAHDSQQYCSCATACRFDLLAAPADAEAAAELQVFTQHLNSAIEQSSKEAMEDTLSDLRERLPFASAVSIVRGSIEGGLPPDDMLQTSLRSRLSSRLLQRSLSMALSSDDSLASTPLRISHSLPPPPQ